MGSTLLIIIKIGPLYIITIFSILRQKKIYIDRDLVILLFSKQARVRIRSIQSFHSGLMRSMTIAPLISQLLTNVGGNKIHDSNRSLHRQKKMNDRLALGCSWSQRGGRRENIFFFWHAQSLLQI